MSQVRRRFPTAWQRVGGHLSAFAELLPQLTNAEDHSFLIARTRLVGRIKNFVIERTANASAAALKAFFDETDTIKNPMVPNEDGTALVPYDGPPLTVLGELNKVARNVAFGRNGAGIHWRSDAINSLKLGEEVTICILQEQKGSYNDNVTLSLTKFDGTKIVI